jgi:hypothetical protein
MKTRSLALVVLAGTFAACGDQAGSGYTKSYGTIRGSITANTPPPGGDLRIALAWLTVQPGQGAFEVSQSVPVSATSFPARFELDLVDLPPDGAISGFFTDEMRQRAIDGGVDPNLTWAQGRLLVYRDGNANGQLDIAELGQSSPDQVLGTASDITVWFVAGGQPAPMVNLGGLPVAPGYSVTHAPLRDPAPGDCGYDDPMGRHGESLCSQSFADDSALLPLPADVTIALGDDSQLADYTCLEFWGAGDWPDFSSHWNRDSPLESQLCSGPACDCTGLDCPLDVPPAGVPVVCNADGTAYTYKTCVADPDLCGTRFCHFGHGERAAGSQPPTGWPCTGS